MPNTAMIERTASLIRHYLTTRPSAADTAEGIHQFWINRDGRAPESIQTTVAALELLAAQGIIEYLNIGNRKIWRLKREALE